MFEFMHQGMKLDPSIVKKKKSTNGKFVAGGLAFAHFLLAVLGYEGREQTNYSLVWRLRGININVTIGDIKTLNISSIAVTNDSIFSCWWI